MGKEGLRYAAKVELDKDAGTLPYLHVSTCTYLVMHHIMAVKFIPHSNRKANEELSDRTDGTPTVSLRRYQSA